MSESLRIRVTPGGFWDRFWASFTRQPTVAATLRHHRVRDAEVAVLAIAKDIADSYPARGGPSIGLMQELRDAVGKLRSAQDPAVEPIPVPGSSEGEQR